MRGGYWRIVTTTSKLRGPDYFATPGASPLSCLRRRSDIRGDRLSGVKGVGIYPYQDGETSHHIHSSLCHVWLCDRRPRISPRSYRPVPETTLKNRTFPPRNPRDSLNGRLNAFLSNTFRPIYVRDTRVSQSQSWFLFL